MCWENSSYIKQYLQRLYSQPVFAATHNAISGKACKNYLQRNSEHAPLPIDDPKYRNQTLVKFNADCVHHLSDWESFSVLQQNLLLGAVRTIFFKITAKFFVPSIVNYNWVQCGLPGRSFAQKLF